MKTGMNRRGFLATLLSGAAAGVGSAVLDKTGLLYALEKSGIEDPEKALWTPEEKTIFIPHEGEALITEPQTFIDMPVLIERAQSVHGRFGKGSVRVTLSDGRQFRLNQDDPILPLVGEGPAYLNRR